MVLAPISSALAVTISAAELLSLRLAKMDIRDFYVSPLGRARETADYTLRRVGKTAEDELYLSWEDSVARASRRYEVVMENYARGLYGRSRHASDELFRLSGDFLDLLAEFRNLRRSMKSAVNAVNENMERYM